MRTANVMQPASCLVQVKQQWNQGQNASLRIPWTLFCSLDCFAAALCFVKLWLKQKGWKIEYLKQEMRHQQLGSFRAELTSKINFVLLHVQLEVLAALAWIPQLHHCSVPVQNVRRAWMLKPLQLLCCYKRCCVCGTEEFSSRARNVLNNAEG